MNFFVTGVGGQLGHDVMNELLKRGHEGVGSDIQETYSGVADGSAVTKAPYVALDITDKEAVEKVITEVNPDAVIHCAAWTAVDMAEDDDKVAKVRAINAGGTQNIADVCKKLDCKMTYISTDYVFDGQGTVPWQPDCKDYKPLNVYGQTKLEGELAVSQTLEKYFIVRIAWVFGLNGKNFIKTILFDPEFKYVALYRCAHSAIYGNKFKKVIWRVLLKRASIKYGYEIAPECVIGPGLRLVHRGGVCINPAAVLGENVTIFHGVTIGSTRRGKLKGSPTIGNKVWIGSNASIVGKIAIGDDVLIAPNSYVNMDVPSHSVCLGNPARIFNKENPQCPAEK